jgi:hypothetical protein
MKKIIKLRWVLWFHIQKYDTNYYRNTKGANFFEFVRWGYKISIGMPWAKPFVEYEVLNSYGIGVKGIEKNNKDIISAPGFKILMPAIKYTLITNPPG